MEDHLLSKKKLIFLAFIFCSLLQSIFTYVTREVTYDQFLDGEEEYDIQEGITYKVSYTKGQITQNYIRVKATLAEETENVYIYFSHLNDNREQAALLNSLYQQEVSIYINKAFATQEADGTFYVTIVCYSSTCSFELSVLELDEIDLSRDESYSYFVTEKRNSDNTFKVLRADSFSEEAYLTFWASGTQNIQMNVKYVDESEGVETPIETTNYENGKIVFIKESDYPVDEYKDSTTTYFIIEVSSDPNILVTVGSKITLIPNGESKYRPQIYIPNSKEIQGVLNSESKIDCFDLQLSEGQNQKYYLNIIDYKKSIDIHLRNKDGTEEDVFSIPDGMTTIEINSNYANSYVCLEKNNENVNEAFYTMQVTDKESQGNYQNIYSPQINGYSYVRILQPGQQAFYTGLPVLNFKTEYRYNLRVISGYPKMYFVKCTTYPNCKFDLSNLPEDTKTPHEVNGLYSYSIFKTEITSSIAGNQYVLLAYCQNEDSTPCKFETNFYSEKDSIALRENQKSFDTIMKDGKSNYVINLNNESEFKQIFVDFLTFSGDVSIDYLAEGFSVRNYVAGNKKYFVVDKKGETQAEKIYFYISGNLASHYAVNYKLIHSDDDKKIMTGETGISYLETIEPKVGYKTINLINKKVAEKKNFLVNFVSLNCQISVKRKVGDKETQLENINYMTQDVFVRTEESASEYDVGEYSYRMDIVKMDNVTEYDQNWCMIYVSSVEQNDNESNYKNKQITVAEGVVNQVILGENFPKIQYIYPHINPNGYVLINFNLETQSKLNLKIYIENEKYSEFSIGKSQYYIIEESTLRQEKYCPRIDTKPNQPCNIIIEFTLNNNFYSEEPVIEFIIKSKEVVPAFVRKSMLRQDVIVGNFYQYYFTEVGKNEEGNIIINFNRGGGQIYGRIVSKDANEGQGWMGRFILPDESNNELKYEHYTKKIIYNIGETEKCQIGCYLLLKVVHTMTDEYYNQENIGYPISISVHANDGTVPFITPSLLTIIDVPINEFIIGDTSPLNLESLLDYYTFWIPYDCEELIFEFLTDSCVLYINVGDEKPTKSEHDFIFTDLGYNSVYRLTKSDILKNNPNEDSIKNKQLTIAVGAKYFDDVNSSLYSLRIRARRANEIELIELTSEQKTLCDIKGQSGNCYFLLPHHRKIDEYNNFFFYALEIPNVKFNYYADVVDQSIIIGRDQEQIKKIIPNENSKWVSKNYKGNYLYIPYNEIAEKDNGVYILINLQILAELKGDEEKTIIDFMHTAYSYSGFYLPNPSSYQLFSIKKNKPIEFNFLLDNQNAIIHIGTISGKGKIYWDDSELSNDNSNEEQGVYYLNNPGDALDLTIGRSEVFPLHISNADDDENENEEPGFGFYIYYKLISKRDNYNEIIYGSTQEIDFKDSEFPFIFYSRIPDVDHEIDVMIKLNNLIKAENTNYYLQSEESEIIKNNEFEIIGLVTEEEIIYTKKAEPEVIPSDKNKFKGVYYPESKIARIQFTKEKIKEFNIKGTNYLYIILNRTESNTQEYQSVSMECSVLPTNKDGYFSPMNMYNQAKIPKNQNGYIRYELNRISSQYKYMRIEFAANTDKINFAIINNDNSNNIKEINYYENNTVFAQGEVYGGKSVLVVNLSGVDNVMSVYLSVFNKENSKHINYESKLSNFVFKYELSEKNDFSKLKPDNETLQFKYEGGTITVNIPAIKGMETNTNVNFYAKLVPGDELVGNEKIDTITQIESKSSKIYTKSVIAFNDEQVLDMVDINNDKKYYVVVLAEVFRDKSPEVFTFKTIANPTKYQEKDNDSSYKWTILVLIIIVVLVAIILILACLFLRNTIRRKTIQLNDLNEQFSKGKNVLEE